MKSFSHAEKLKKSTTLLLLAFSAWGGPPEENKNVAGLITIQETAPTCTSDNFGENFLDLVGTIATSSKAVDSLSLSVEEKSQKTVRQILKLLERFRKSSGSPEIDEKVTEYLTQRLSEMIQNGIPIQLALAGFSNKFPNTRTQVLGHLPDLAEKTAIKNLGALLGRIQAIYPPGAQLVISAEGRLWEKIMKLNSQEVGEYHSYLRDIPRHGDIRFVNFDDLIPDAPKGHEVESFLNQFAQPTEVIQKLIATSDEERKMFEYFKKSMSAAFPRSQETSPEDYDTHITELAVQVTRGSKAYQRLVQEKFSEKILMWPQPQGPNIRKIGVNLVSPEDHISPWQGVAVKSSQGGVTLMHKDEAESQGHQLIHVKGQPHHYEEKAKTSLESN